jgi:hypothetical protein
MLELHLKKKPPSSGRFWEALEAFRILDQNAMARALSRRPLGNEVEQHRVVRLVVEAKIRVRPIAAPYQTFGRGFDLGLRDFGDIAIARRPDLGIDIGSGERWPSRGSSCAASSKHSRR